MTPTQWMGAVILAGAVAFWIYDGLSTAASKIRQARRLAESTPSDDLMAVADAVDDWTAWDRELAAGDTR